MKSLLSIFLVSISCLTFADVCRNSIPGKICITDDPDSPFPECEADNGNFSVQFQKAYDAMPLPFKRVFCHLEEIVLYPTVRGASTAMLSASWWEGSPYVNLKMRKAFLESSPKLSNWLTWYEQLPFGTDVLDDQHHVLENGPEIIANDEFSPLLMLLIHEFSHAFDFLYGVNDYCYGQNDCFGHPTPVKYRDFNFTNGRVKPEHRFPYVDELSFDGSGSPIPVDAASQIYAGLDHTGFATTYGSTDPIEDFADSLTLYLFTNYYSEDYQMVVGDQEYSIRSKIESAAWAKRKTYLENFINREDVKNLSVPGSM